MVKIVAGLVAIQLAILIFLGSRIGAVDERLDALVMADQTVPGRHGEGRSAERTAASQKTQTASDEARLRRVIREELARISAVAPETERAPGTAAGAASTTREDEQASREDEYEYMAVNDQLDFHISQGRVSQTDMLRLQHAIARLQPARRTELLSRLNRALNSGELKGRM